MVLRVIYFTIDGTRWAFAFLVADEADLFDAEPTFVVESVTSKLSVC